MTPPQLLKDRVLAAAQGQKSRTRAQGKRRALFVYSVAILSVVLVFVGTGGLAHSAGRPLEYTLGIALGAAAIAAVASWLSLRPGRRLAGQPKSVLVAVLLGVPLLTLAWLALWHGSYAEPFARIGYRCLALSLVMGGSVLAAGLLVRGRTQPTNAGWTGAAMAAASAACAGIPLVLWCPLTNAPHSVVGHVLPVFLLSLVGAVVGRYLLPPSVR